MKKKTLFFIFSGLLVLLLVVLAVNILRASKSSLISGNLISGNEKEVSSQIEKLYELINPGSDATVVKIDDESGVYKVLLKHIDISGGITYREAYITRDGKLMTENMIVISRSIEQLDRIYKFVDCLNDKGVKIFGVTNHTATTLQFNLLGGAYSTNLYASCDGELAQKCVDAGITQVPSVVYNNSIYPGVQPVLWFQNLTGCVF